MTDFYGALRMPQSTPSATEAIGDPCLVPVLDYIKTFVNSRLATAWGSIISGGVLINTAQPYDPVAQQINPADLPALYGWRKSGAPTWMAADYRVSKDEITLQWLLPSIQRTHLRLRSRMVNAVAKAIDVAIERDRFPGWVHDADKADADGILLARATSTSAQSFVTLDGAVGGLRLSSPRKITASATTVAGAYTLSGIIIEGLDEDGEFLTDTLTPTSLNGGWLLEGVEEFARVTRVAVPAQTLATGAISIGHTADEQALDEGSVLLRHAGLMSLSLTGWKETVLQIKLADGSPPRMYEALELALTCEERWTSDIEEYFDPLTQTDVDFVNEDGVLFEQAIYE